MKVSSPQIEMEAIRDYETSCPRNRKTGKHRRYNCLCLLCCLLCLMVIGICLFLLYPRKIQLCYKLHLGWGVLTGREGDEGEYDIKIKNRNFYSIDLYDFEYDIYYGKRVEDYHVLTFPIGDWTIGPRTTSFRKETYVHTTRFTSVVPRSRILGCFAETVDDLSFNISAKLTGCVADLCRVIEKNNFVYVRKCPSDGRDWGCLDYSLRIFG